MHPDDDAPLVEETPQEFADSPELPFERKLRGERADGETGDDDLPGDDQESGEPGV